MSIILHLMKIILNQNGLYFKLNDNKYYKFEDLISNISGTLNSNEVYRIDIEWIWDYEGNYIKDTLEGTLAKNYSFGINIMTKKLS